jgi:hypothetical protein
LNLRIQPLETRHILEVLFFSGMPIVLILLAHWLFNRHKTWRVRGWIVYGAWILILLLISFVFSAAIGGVSMAVVEGVAGSVLQRYLQYLQFAATLTLVGNVLIIPWTLFVIIIFKAMNKKFELWQEDNPR